MQSQIKQLQQQLNQANQSYENLSFNNQIMKNIGEHSIFTSKNARE